MAPFYISGMEEWINSFWESDIKKSLCDYVKIPCVSPQFDPDWDRNIDAATLHFSRWIHSQQLKHSFVEVLQLGTIAPVIYIEIAPHGMPDRGAPTVLFYGHLDKQPADPSNWAEGLHPYKPVIRDEKLYGRGAADDGYALYSVIASIKYLQEHNLSHPHIIVLIEAAEESGSPDLMQYLDHLMPNLSRTDLIIALDGECADYDSLWVTASLRGCVEANLNVSVMSEGVHSGIGGGVVPSSFRIARKLLSRIEDESTGEIKLPQLHVEIPQQVKDFAGDIVKRMSNSIISDMPLLEGVRPQTEDVVDCILNRSWRPCLEIVGADGLPPCKSAGNVLRPSTSLKLTMRLPPGVNGADAEKLIKSTLESNPPYGAKVSVDFAYPASAGWYHSNTGASVINELSECSQKFFGKPLGYMLQGVSVPSVSVFTEKFPQAQFVITGVLGPKSNPHGPNESLHIPMFIKLTCCMTQLLQDYCAKK